MRLGQPAAQQTVRMYCRIAPMTKSTPVARAAKMVARAPRPPLRHALPRATRDCAATEKRNLGVGLGAVGDVLARDGFTAIGVNAIAKQAGVDKVLIYRYFGGLPELLQTWGASGRFWSEDRGRERRSPSPPSEPAVQFSRDGLSSQLFPHRDWRAN